MRLLPILAVLGMPAHAAGPAAGTLFDQAVHADLDGGADGAARAFRLYGLAATTGLPRAELNLALMYDSGRGTARDAVAAATWYAAAALGGLARAAFDLGQLYAAGDGVPRNAGLAQAWFGQARAQGIAAAARTVLPDPPGADLAAPALRHPPADTALPPQPDGLVLVWTAASAPAPTVYFVQVMGLPPNQAAPALLTTSLSAARLFPAAPGRYVWRVFVACPTLGRYVASGWATFSVG